MRTRVVRALLLPWLAGGIAGEPTRLTPDQAAPLRAARQIAVQIRQVYSWQELDDQGNVKEEKTDDPNAEKKPRDLLPLAEETAKALAFSGWRQAPAGGDAKVRLEFEISGRALGGDYTGTVSGYQYSGAEVSGHVAVMSEGVEFIRESISARIEPPYSVNRFYSRSWDAPFGQLTKDCLTAVYVALDAVHGPGPLLAAVNSDDSLHRESATLALCRQAEEGLQPALLDLLRRGDAERRAVAAALLGVVGDEQALAPLLEALRATAGEENTDGNYPDYEWEELLRFEHVASEQGSRRDSAPSLATGSAREAVLWALLQNPAPDKTARLIVALGDRKMPVLARRGLALVLGQLDDKAAGPALAAAARDRSPLVQAAALTALKGHRFHESGEAVAAVLALTTSAHARVRALAREVAGDYSAARAEQYLAAKYGKDSSRHPRHVHEELLAHADPLVRMAGVTATLATGTEDLSPVSRLLRSDPVPCVRETALKLLASYYPDKHTDDFIFALADADEPTRTRALQVLKGDSNPELSGPEEGSEEAKPPPLPARALAPLLALAGTNYDAVKLLARVQGEGINDALLAAAERKGAGAPTREAALTELARRGDRRATGALAAFLAAGEPVAWRQALQQAAGRLDDDALVDPLIKILRQGPEGSQAMAAELLGAMSHTRAVGPMIVALRLAQERNRQDLTDPLRRGLQDLTGQYHHSPDDWLAWWKQNAGKPLIKPRAQ